MSRYNNEFDEDDDGDELEITDEEEAASDDEGREAAAPFMAHCESIVGNRKVHEDQRRMWFRLAKKALAEGAERREAAEAAKEERREAGRREEEARIAREEEERQERELVEREERRAEIRRRNAEAARIEAEAARARAARPAGVSAPVTWPVVAPPVRRVASTEMPSRASLGAMSDTSRPSPVPARQGSVVVVLAPKPASRQAPPRALPVVQPVSNPRDRPIQAAGPARPAPPSLAVRPAPKPAAVPVASTHSSSPSAGVVEAPPVPSATHERPLTGADLAHWRAGRGITQRAAAERLGVAPSTVAKAELVPGKVLGEQLMIALRGAIAE